MNSVIHDVLSKKNNVPIDIMVLDCKQMFDSECLFECLNDLYESGIDDDIFSLIHEANREIMWLSKHPVDFQEEKLSRKLLCKEMFWHH